MVKEKISFVYRDYKVQFFSHDLAPIINLKITPHIVCR